MFTEQSSISRTGFIGIKQGSSHNLVMWDTKALDMADKSDIFNVINGVDGYIQGEYPYKSIYYNCQFILYL